MKTLIVIEENRTQLVLQPESKHDESVLTTLEMLPNTHRVEFYQTQGGWTARRPVYGPSMYGEPKKQADLVIVFDNPMPPESET